MYRFIIRQKTMRQLLAALRRLSNVAMTPWMVFFALLFGSVTQAQGATTDWGVITLEELVTISFSNQDLTKSFTDQYLFTLTAESGTTYEVTVNYQSCNNGCGSIAIDYAIFDANGSQIDDSGSVVLASGEYVFQVKGTGMGSGNEISYSGTITFNGADSQVVTAFISPVPEPHEFALGLLSSALLGMGLWRHQRRKNAQGAAPFGLRRCDQKASFENWAIPRG